MNGPRTWWSTGAAPRLVAALTLTAVSVAAAGCSANDATDAVVTVTSTVTSPAAVASTTGVPTAADSGGEKPGDTASDGGGLTVAAPSDTGVPATTAASGAHPTGAGASPTSPAHPSSAGTGSPRPSVPPAGHPTPTAASPGSDGLGVTAADIAKARILVAGMSVQDEAASVIMPASADLTGTDLLSSKHFGGVILTGSRGVLDGTATGTPEQVATLTATLRKQDAKDPAGVPPLIGTDQEYGDVTRLVHGFTDFPGEDVLGEIPNLEQATSLTHEVAAAAAQELLAVGISVDFAPVSDVLPVDGSSGIGARSYGDDPQRDAALVTAAVTGYQDGGVAATLKHFPGLGRVPQDSHVTLPTLGVSCDSWNSHEAIPLAAGVKAGVALVMTGHVLLPAVGAVGPPASLSPTVVSDLLRGKGSDGCVGLGFEGVTVSDSLQMEPVTDRYSPGQAAVQGLLAGEDLLLMPTHPDAAATGIADAVADGSLPRSRLDDAATSVLALRLATARIAVPPLSVVDSPGHRTLALKAKAAAGQTAGD